VRDVSDDDTTGNTVFTIDDTNDLELVVTALGFLMKSRGVSVSPRLARLHEVLAGDYRERLAWGLTNAEERDDAPTIVDRRPVFEEEPVCPVCKAPGEVVDRARQWLNSRCTSCGWLFAFDPRAAEVRAAAQLVAITVKARAAGLGGGAAQEVAITEAGLFLEDALAAAGLETAVTMEFGGVPHGRMKNDGATAPDSGGGA
jgi:hypothetical protein